MKRSRLWITVLLSLFIFQSTWNVAAAYCVHESVTEPSVRHFGHHAGVDEATLKQSHKIFKYFDQLSENDHDDHLPSMLYIHSHPNLVEVEHTKIDFRQKTVYIDIHNFYQAPYLNSPKPPPTYIPL